MPGRSAEQAVKLFKVSLTQRRIGCKIDPSTAVKVDAPFYVAAFALANLIGNATDAIWYDGTIWIEAEPADEDDFVLCHVTNSGPAMTDEARKKLFQFGESTKHGHKGWGLYFVQKSIESSGGRIWLAYSDETGTRFTISLPRERTA